MNKLKSIISILLCMTVIFSTGAINVSFAASEENVLLFTESYDGYAENDVPNDVGVEARSYFIDKYEERNKGLLVSAFKTKTSVSYNFEQTAQDACLSFDFMATDGALSGTLSVVGKSGTATAVMKFKNNNSLCAFDGRRITGYGTKMNNYAICINSKKSVMSIYQNGKCISSEYRIVGTTIPDIAGLRFDFDAAPGENDGYILDNINVSMGTKPMKKYPVAAYNEEVLEEIKIKTKAESGDGIIHNDAYNNSSISYTVADRGNTLAIYDDGGNNVVKFERFTSSDFHMDITGVSSNSDYVVYDFDLKILEPDTTSFSVQLKDSNSQYTKICGISAGGTITMGSVSKKLTAKKWYKIAAVYNYFDRVRDYYIDGELVAENQPIEEVFGDGSIAGTYRFYCANATDVDANHASFYIDNTRVYESAEPKEELGTVQRKITVDPKASIFESDALRDEMLKGFTAVHTRSGIVYQNGVKTVLKTAPEGLNGDCFVVADELLSVLGLGNMNIPDSVQKDINGVKYVNVKAFFETVMGKKVYTDSTTKCSGMLIAGDNMFTPPIDTKQLQELNNYLFYIRPSAADVKETYASSPVKGTHPRIFATKADFERIKQETLTNSYKKNWVASTIASADYLVETNTTPLVYEFRDNVRLLYVSRDCLNHMYVLGMAYQLTGDQKYADRAWIDLQAVCGFNDWHPVHDLDTAEMCAAVAIGYDWMYDAFTEEQRAYIENGVYQNGFYVCTPAYQTKTGIIGSSALQKTNHNNVLNGGFSMAALAFMDVYPEICETVVSGAVRAVDIIMPRYAPEGAWFEGPGYWEYATRYTVMMLASLDTVLGTDFGLSKSEGFNQTAEFRLKFQSDVGSLQYSDGSTGSTYSAPMFWLGNKFDNEGITQALLKLGLGKYDPEHSVLALLWYDTGIDASEVNLPLDYMNSTDGATFRSGWETKGNVFAGIHVGNNVFDDEGNIIYHSHLDMGDFTYDYGGKRWAYITTSCPYDLPETIGYSENGKRWSLYNARAEGHNCLVINPGSGPDQKVRSKSKFTRFETKERGGIAVADLSDVYSENASGVRRGFFFTDNRTSIVVRDEISLNESSEVYWFMQTQAEVEIKDNSAILTQGGISVKLDYVTNAASSEISVGPSKPLPTSPVVKGDTQGGCNRIAIKLNGSGNMNITVKLTPLAYNGSDVSDYDMNIDEWEIPDGSIPERPSIISASSGGIELRFDESGSAVLAYAEGKYSTVPDILVNVDASKYDVAVEKAADLTGISKIRVTDKTDATNYRTYYITYKSISSALKAFDGQTTLRIVNLTPSAEPQIENAALNVLDGDLSTRWSAEGMGQYLILELEELTTVDNLQIAFASGNVRKTKITISVSADGVNYEDVFDGWSSGETLDYEKIPLGGKSAKYVKVTGDGNTAQGLGGWNSITEVSVTKNN